MKTLFTFRLTLTEVVDAFGNPSSGHWASVPAKDALEKARGQVADLLGCAVDEVVFTSGGSRGNNLALKGVFFALRHKGEHIITTAVEHPAILGPLRVDDTTWQVQSRNHRVVIGSHSPLAIKSR